MQDLDLTAERELLRASLRIYAIVGNSEFKAVSPNTLNYSINKIVRTRKMCEIKHNDWMI